MHIALFGGSFDPIHAGHLRIARTALRKLAIDEVWFLPCQDAPLKDGQHASFTHRCAMIQWALQPYRKMQLCTIEGQLEGVSYTIRTIRELKRRYPQHSFSFLIGDDQAAQFDCWKDSEQLKQEAMFYVFSRSAGAIVPEGMKRVPMELIDVSSTAIRQGQQHWALPKSVKRYMGEHGLYLEEQIQRMLPKKRYEHSRSVAQLCAELAAAHHLDETIAWQMGMLHDICKTMPKQQAEIWMRHHLPQRLCEPIALWHGYLGADFAKHAFYIRDERILSAIYHHVRGDGTSPYAIILYVADKLDPYRGYDVSEQIALCKQDLHKGYQRVQQEQQEYLRKEGVIT